MTNVTKFFIVVIRLIHEWETATNPYPTTHTYNIWIQELSVFPARESFFLAPQRPDWPWDPPSILSSSNWGLYPWDVKLATHLHLVPRLRMRGDIPPLHHTSSWRGASLGDRCVFIAWYFVKYRDNFIFTLNPRILVCVIILLITWRLYFSLFKPAHYLKVVGSPRFEFLSKLLVLLKFHNVINTI
jgi:hypothetical protein